MPNSQTGAFVGRERELRALRGELDAALRGDMRIALLVGEAGIGKTRTSTALLEEARKRGAWVAWGRGHESGGAPIYRPWVQLLTGLAADVLEPFADPIEAASRALQGGALLTGETSPEGARFALFDRVTHALSAAAAERPLLLVLDDLHWADLGSLRLLEFVAREIVASPLLLVATLRPGEERHDDERARALASVMSLGRSVPLGGLDGEAVGVLLGDRMDAAPDADLIAQVMATTGGNPFLVIEVSNLLAASDGRAGLAGVPPGARELLRRRLSVLEPDERRTLAAAAVIGVGFDSMLLARVLGEPEAEVLGRLEAVARLGLVREVEGALRRFCFAHALLRETAYGDLSAGERIPLHLATAEALEAQGSDRGDHLPLLAHHYFEAARQGDARRAVFYCLAAGDQALRLLAFEEAVAHYERALSAQVYAEDGGRWRALAGLGQALHGSGDHERARTAFGGAVAEARAAGPEAFASAVLRYASAEAETMLPDLAMNALLEEVLEVLGPVRLSLRALVLARLSWGLHLLPGTEARRRRLSDEAAELARSLDEPYTLEMVLTTRLRDLHGMNDVAERQATVDQILAGVIAPSAELDALSTRIADHAESGDRSALDRTLAVYEQKARSLRQPYFVWGAASFRTAMALLEGRFDDTERLAHEALELGSRVLSHSPGLQFAQQMFMLRGWQARFDEVEPLLRSAVGTNRVVPGWRCGLAYFCAFSGREAEARRELGALSADGFAELPRDGSWSIYVNLLALTCIRLDDAERAEPLYRMLLPYRGRIAVTRPFVALGHPIDHLLAGLATVLSRFDAAEEHFAAALAISKRMRGLPWQVELGYLQADLLRRRDAEGDRARALELLDAAKATATEIGMDLLVGWISERRSRIMGGVAPEPGASPHAYGTFRREGDTWTLAFESRTSRFRHMLGLAHLARLLAEPGREIHVIELVNDGRGDDGSATRGDAGELLDAKARSAYEARLRAAAEEIEEAERMNDRGRMEILRDEVEAISSELSRGFGVGGRARRAGSAQERARVAVTRAIKYAIDKIDTHDPALAEHLRASVRTGTFLSYRPSSRDPVRWEL